MLRFLPDHVRSICRESNASTQQSQHHDHSPPLLAADDDGIAVVIDISGYTALTNSLLDSHGTDGAARLRDAVNEPFEKIIRIVYGRSGSIVKFVGDAAIACWSQVGTDRRLQCREYRLLQALASCLELLCAFRPEEKAVQRTAAAAEAPLNIHIGLGLGRLYHIHLGESAPGAALGGVGGCGGARWSDVRREYLIAGEAVSDAGDALSLGRRGEFIMSAKYYRALEALFARLPIAVRLSALSVPIQDGSALFYLVQQASEEVNVALSAMANLAADHSKDSVVGSAGINNQLAMRYVEQSVAAHITESLLASDGIEDHYSETRRVTVVFFRFPNVQLSIKVARTEDKRQAVSELNLLGTLQRISTAVIRCVRDEGGSLRQINFDEKGFTALAVWGLKGLAHQRGEAQYALSACIKLQNVLRNHGTNALDTETNAFHAGVATGVVYAGFVGTNLRSDGTVLGSPVNLAARLMFVNQMEEFNEQNDGQLSVFCDEATYLNAGHEVAFHPKSAELKLKGFGEAIKVFKLARLTIKRLKTKGETVRSKKETTNSVLFGRSSELDTLTSVFNLWTDGSSHQRVLLTGRSGLGKSFLLDSFRSNLPTDSKLLICQCEGDEITRNISLSVMDFVIQSVIEQFQCAGIKPEDFARQPGHWRGSRQQLAPRKFSEDSVDLASRRTSYDSRVAQASPAWQYLANILSALSIPKSAHVVLAAIPGMKAFSDKERILGGDVTNRLAMILAQVLTAGHDAGYTVCMICDDIQWFDPESLKVIIYLLKFTPRVFYLLAGRIREEWDMPAYFDEIQKLSHGINLEPMGPPAVAAIVEQQLGHPITERLLSEIMSKTNGIPMAIQVTVAAMKARGWTKSERLAGRELTILSRDQAVAAQLDLLDPVFRTVLSVAAVIGQQFDLDTLSAVLLHLSNAKHADFTVPQLEDLIIARDRFGFLHCVSREGKKYSFRHYLLQQDVSFGLLPARRNTINRAIFRVFEQRLIEEGDNGRLLPTVVARVVQLTGESELKSKYLYRGFLAAAEDYKAVEALLYLDQLTSINPAFLSGLSVLEELRHFRLLASIYSDQGDIKKAWDMIVRLLNTGGFFPQKSHSKPMRAMSSLLYHLTTVFSTKGASEIQSQWKCIRYIQQTFPLVYKECFHTSKSPRAWRRSIFDERQFSKLDALISEISRGLELLWQMAYAGAPKAVGLTEILMFTCQLSGILLAETGHVLDSILERTKWRSRLKMTLAQFASMCIIIKMSSAAAEYKRLADAVTIECTSSEDYFCNAIYMISIPTTYLYERRRVDLHFLYAVNEAIRNFQEGGAEFGAFCLSLCIIFHQVTQVIGQFDKHPPGTTSHFDLAQAVELLHRQCPNRQSALRLRACLALQLAIQCMYDELDNFIVHVEGIDFREAMNANGIPVTNFVAVLSFVRAICLTIEESNSPQRTDSLVQTLSQAVLDLVHTRKLVDVNLLPTSMYSVMLCAITIAHVGLGLLDNSRQQSSRCNEELHRVCKAILHDLGTAAATSRAQTPSVKCTTAIVRAVATLFGGKNPLSQFEAKCRRVLELWDDFLHEHVSLMLRGRVCRANWLRRPTAEGHREMLRVIDELGAYDTSWERHVLERYAR
ncbi:hypothetical protein DFJ73DRAFT_961948 [Zopfochytrium polystomum]|nr:hypothetical protein DFJ73DRAFT_961948 [Zopfochytrium polystomum]